MACLGSPNQDKPDSEIHWLSKHGGEVHTYSERRALFEWKDKSWPA